MGTPGNIGQRVGCQAGHGRPRRTAAASIRVATMASPPGPGPDPDASSVTDDAPPAPIEVRMLTGPNLYFTRPAVKMTLDARPALAADPATFSGWQRQVGGSGPVGLPGSDARIEATAALAGVDRPPGRGQDPHQAGRRRPGRATTARSSWPSRSATGAPPKLSPTPRPRCSRRS